MLCDGLVGHAHIKIGVHQSKQVHFDVVARGLGQVFVDKDVFYAGVPQIEILDDLSFKVHIFYPLEKLAAPARGILQETASFKMLRIKVGNMFHGFL
jgi:hypothetical protein